MIETQTISYILDTSPSVELLKLKNCESIIIFFVETFYIQQGSVISSESIHTKLTDYLEGKQIENDDESETTAIDTYETKAKKLIQKWTNKGFLTNYQKENGEVFYELSSHSSKTINWLSSLKKEEYIGTESKFKNIFNQLKELVEYTNEDTPKRIQLLEDNKLEIEQKIQRIKDGENAKVFEKFEIVYRFNQLNQSAKELLSDFKEVESNFKEITKSIYQKHAEGNLTKSDILKFTFDALDDLKDSQQGKSFYAFYSFLFTRELQNQWERLTEELYKTLKEKEITITNFFLKDMKKFLNTSGKKVSEANDKMAEKLNRIIGENEAIKSAATKNVIQEIKKILIEISKTKKRPEISFELETVFDINIPFEKKLTFELVKEYSYEKQRLKLADEDIVHSDLLKKLFVSVNIDKELLRKRIKEVLKNKSQTTLLEVIENNGGIEKGLPELFGYIGMIKEFKHSISPEKTQRIVFDNKKRKAIQIPEIILIK